MEDLQNIAQQKYQATKELSEIQMNLATAKAEYKEMQDNLISFRKIRETETKKRIDDYIKSSSEALESIGENYRLIKDFKSQTLKTLEDTKTAHNFVNELFASLESFMDDIEKYFTQKVKQNNELVENIKQEYKNIAKEKEELAAISKKQKEMEKVLRDRRGTLERAWMELEKKQIE